MGAFEFESFGSIDITGSGVHNFPFTVAKLARLKNDPTSAGTINVGLTGTTPTYPLAAGNDTDWFSTENLARYCFNGVTGSVLHYWLQR